VRNQEGIMRAISCFCGVVVATAVLGTPVLAQTTPDTPDCRDATTITAFAGTTLGTASTPLLGAGAGWRFTPRVSVEGTGLWVPDRSGATGFAGALKAEIGLTRHHPATPFVQAGFGLYRARFDRDRSDIPGFYARRLGPAFTSGAMATFTDPAAVFGGGFNLAAGRRVSVRPDVESMVVMRGGRARVITAVRMHLVYHFEDHPVTPSRTGR
jgi:hypothetical protein